MNITDAVGGEITFSDEQEEKEEKRSSDLKSCNWLFNSLLLAMKISIAVFCRR